MSGRPDWGARRANRRSVLAISGVRNPVGRGSAALVCIMPS